MGDLLKLSKILNKYFYKLCILVWHWNDYCYHLFVIFVDRQRILWRTDATTETAPVTKLITLCLFSLIKNDDMLGTNVLESFHHPASLLNMYFLNIISSDNIHKISLHIVCLTD